MKATEQYFPEVVHYAAQGGSIIRLSLSRKSWSVTIQMKWSVLSCNYAYCVTIILTFFVSRFGSFIFWDVTEFNLHYLHYYQNEVKGDFQKSEMAGRAGHFENETGLLRVCA